MKQQLRISVRDLVEFLEQSGDLDSRSGRGGRCKNHAGRKPSAPEDSGTDGKWLPCGSPFKIPERVGTVFLTDRGKSRWDLDGRSLYHD